MSTKICNNCGRELDVSQFKNKRGKPYYICKECEREYMLNYRNLKREHINRQHIEYMNKYKQDKENKEHLKEYHRNYNRKRLCIDECRFRGPNQLEKGQSKYTKSQIIKMSRYGLTPEQFDSLPNKCEVCGSVLNLCIDHNHTTGKFRGVLCHNCNLALGHLHDNPEIIYRLLNYLKEKEK